MSSKPKKECTWCGNELHAYELSDPKRDNSGDVMCDSCHEKHFEDYCSRCDELVDEDEVASTPGQLIALYENAPVRSKDPLKAGYYRVLKWPFFADGMITAHFFSEALQRVGDLDTKGLLAAKHARTIAGPMCSCCRDEVEKSMNKKRMAGAAS